MRKGRGQKHTFSMPSSCLEGADERQQLTLQTQAVTRCTWRTNILKVGHHQPLKFTAMGALFHGNCS
jgi:hypothetical protein